MIWSGLSLTPLRHDVSPRHDVRMVLFFIEQVLMSFLKELVMSFLKELVRSLLREIVMSFLKKMVRFFSEGDGHVFSEGDGHVYPEGDSHVFSEGDGHIFPSYRNLQLTGVYNLLSAIINSLIYESVNKKCSCRVVVGRYHFDEY